MFNKICACFKIYKGVNMSKKVGLLFAILLSVISIVACTSEEQIGNQDNIEHKEIQTDKSHN